MSMQGWPGFLILIGLAARVVAVEVWLCWHMMTECLVRSCVSYYQNTLDGFDATISLLSLDMRKSSSRSF